MHVLELKNIRKRFGKLAVLQDITVTVAKGEVVAIIGPSGSGKSTLLRCATMLETIDSGEIVYMGEYAAKDGLYGRAVYSDAQTMKRIRGYYGLVFQNFNLFPHYSVLKNVTDALVSVQKRPKDQANKEAMALLVKMGLEDKADSYPYQLSGGQQQRVSIVRALALKPEVLFFDEPTSALDPELTGEVLKVIRSLTEENMTMVIVTHEMQFARHVADKVYFMDDGLVVEQGTPDEVLGAPKEERTKRFLERYSHTA
jgi:polar amino acid transport system ATP-binding protein